MIQLLVSRGAMVDCQNNLKNTPLHFAAGAGQADAVRLLLRLGADRTIKDAAGYTAEDLVRLAGDENTRKAFKDTQQAASADIATGAKKKISKAPRRTSDWTVMITSMRHRSKILALKRREKRTI